MMHHQSVRMLSVRPDVKLARNHARNMAEGALSEGAFSLSASSLEGLLCSEIASVVRGDHEVRQFLGALHWSVRRKLLGQATPQIASLLRSL